MYYIIYCLECGLNYVPISCCSACYHPAANSTPSSRCPECRVPIWIRELNPNRQLNNIINAVKNIKKITSNKPPSRPTDARTTTDAGGVIQGMPCDFLDVINMEQIEPAAHEGTPAGTALASGETAVCHGLDKLKRRVKRDMSTRRRGQTSCDHSSRVSCPRDSRAVSLPKRKCSIIVTRVEAPGNLQVCSSSREACKSSALLVAQGVSVSSVTDRDPASAGDSQPVVDIDRSGDSCITAVTKEARASRNALVQPDRCGSSGVSTDCSEAIFRGASLAKDTKCRERLPRSSNGHTKGTIGLE